MGKTASDAVFVDSDGNVDYDGDLTTMQFNAIRPALWIDKTGVEL